MGRAILLLLVVLSSCASRKELPQVVPLGKTPLVSENAAVVYDQYFLRFPTAGVFQAHEGLDDKFTKEGSSVLCLPAALAFALLQERDMNPKAKGLVLKGTSADGATADANVLIRDLVECTKTDLEKGTKTYNAIACLNRIFAASELTADIHFVARWEPESATKLDRNVKHVNRLATPADIQRFLRAGYNVIAAVDFYQFQKGTGWTIGKGHVINIGGFSRQNSWPPELLNLYVHDPFFSFDQTDYPVFDSVLMSKSRVETNLASFTTAYFLEGYPFPGLASRVFLSELLIFKTR